MTTTPNSNHTNTHDQGVEQTADGALVDPMTRAASLITRARQHRPNLPDSTQCPFCPGGLEAPEDYDIRVFPNRWPALGEGRCEVVLYTSDHDAEFWTLGDEGAARVVDTWAERTEALGSRPEVNYVLVFENRGPEVGATIEHPHGQIYAYQEIPPLPMRVLVDGVFDLASVPEGLRVAASGQWQAFVPPSPTWPYELRILSQNRTGSLTDSDCDRTGLSQVLMDVLARLDQLFDAPMPYMMWIYQRPTDGHDWPEAEVSVHIAPLYRAPGVIRYVAAAEIGGGVYFNPKDPYEAASELRALPGIVQGLHSSSETTTNPASQ